MSSSREFQHDWSVGHLQSHVLVKYLIFISFYNYMETSRVANMYLRPITITTFIYDVILISCRENYGAFVIIQCIWKISGVVIKHWMINRYNSCKVIDVIVNNREI